MTCNAAGAEILGHAEDQIVGRSVHDLFDRNPGILALVEEVMATSESGSLMDVDLQIGTDEGAEAVSVNVTGVPLRIETNDEGTIILLENISSEKRIRSTMARYMDPALADRLVRGGEDILGGTSAVVTLLFTDIRGFTTLAEQLGPQATVSMLNEYFTLMVDCIQHEGGMLDKFIGDAIMAAFGLPEPQADDADRAVRTAIAMIRSLNEWNSTPGRRWPTADQHGHRPQHRHRGRRQHRLTEADGLHDDRRRREPRGSTRECLQGVPRPDPDQ